MKKMHLATVLLASAAFALTGCSSKTDDHGHDHADDKGKSKPHDDHGHSHDGPKTELGSQKAGDWTLTLTQIGALTAGKEAVFEVGVAPKAEGASVRISFRDAAGNAIAGSAAEKASGSGDDFDAHIMAPANLPADAKLLVEIEKGTVKQQATFALKK
jgi:hypothetical protein